MPPGDLPHLKPPGRWDCTFDGRRSSQNDRRGLLATGRSDRSGGGSPLWPTMSCWSRNHGRPSAILRSAESPAGLRVQIATGAYAPEPPSSSSMESQRCAPIETCSRSTGCTRNPRRPIARGNRARRGPLSQVSSDILPTEEGPMTLSPPPSASACRLAGARTVRHDSTTSGVVVTTNSAIGRNVFVRPITDMAFSYCYARSSV